MASTNKTPNLELPQWEAADSFGREDLNSAFEKIDAGIKETRDTRLKAELLMDLTVPASNTTVMSVDISEINLAAYKFVFIAFPKLISSRLYLNQNGPHINYVMDGCYMYGFPVFTENCKATFVVVFKDEIHTLTSITDFSGINSLYFLGLSDQRYTTESQVRIWGVK